MTSKITSMAAGVCILPLLAGCGHSPPTRFFTLDPVPAEALSTASASPATAIVPVQLDAVHIPPVLDRPNLVVHLGPDRVAVEGRDEWAAPLGEVMRGTLAQDLLLRLPKGSFILPGAPRPAGVRGLVVDVLQLRADSNGRVTLQASWSLVAGDPLGVILTRTLEVAVNERPGPGGAAAATSRLLGLLADRIAAGLAPA